MSAPRFGVNSEDLVYAARMEWRDVTKKLLALGIGGIIALLSAEGTLALLNFPMETRYTYPADYEQDRNHIEFSYHFAANSQGLRSPEIPLQRPEGAQRVLVVGDSYTEGVGVEYDETFCGILDREFRTDDEIDFINGGIRGRGPLHYGRVFMTAGLQYDPTTLLIALHTNDLADMDPSTIPQDLYSERRSGLKRLLNALWPRSYILARTSLKSFRVSEDEEGYVEGVRRIARTRNISDQEVDRWLARVPPRLLEAAERREFGRTALSLSRSVPAE